MKFTSILRSMAIVISGVVSVANVSGSRSVEEVTFKTFFQDTLADMSQEIKAAETQREEVVNQKQRLEGLFADVQNKELSDDDQQRIAVVLNELLMMLKIARITAPNNHDRVVGEYKKYLTELEGVLKTII